MSEYFKVVRLFEDGVRGSAITPRESAFFHHYVPGEWVRVRQNPFKYGLFVFTSYDVALEFAIEMRMEPGTLYEIWRVDVEDPRPLPTADELTDNPSVRMVDALIMRECVRRVP
jgi:hypothetical protein